MTVESIVELRNIGNCLGFGRGNPNKGISRSYYTLIHLQANVVCKVPLADTCVIEPLIHSVPDQTVLRIVNRRDHDWL